MRTIIKKLIFEVLYFSGLNALAGMFMTRRAFLVGYHSIGSDKNRARYFGDRYRHITIEQSDFEAQLAYLWSHGHTFVHLSRLGDPDVWKLSKPTVIYFDDGFKDIIENALPVMQRFGALATVFLTSGLIDRTVVALPRFSKGTALTAHDADAIFLSWSEVAELEKKSVEFGAHGMLHKKFIECNHDELERELLDPREKIRETLGHDTTLLSYPHGRTNESVVARAKSLGYTLGVCTQEGTNTRVHVAEQPFMLQKIAPKPGDPLRTFAVKLYAGNWLKALERLW